MIYLIKNEFVPLPDDFLNSKSLLTKSELSSINQSVREISSLIDLCKTNDKDVLDYYEVYLEKLSKRVEYYIAKIKKKNNS